MSVIVPTLNEAANIDDLLAAIFRECGDGIEFEVVIADGGSTDGTVERAKAWEAVADVHLVACRGKRGLAGDVLEAAALARTDVVVVMDGDLSHPPDRLRALVEPVLGGASDMVVGSRFVAGGAIAGWPFRRLMLSRLGSALAWPLTDLADPMSGFFAVHRERLLAVDENAAGFKIGLEIIARNGGLRVEEIPITFVDRVHGRSKIGTAELLAYLRRLPTMAGGAVSVGGAARFAAVGCSGMIVDLLLFQALLALGAAAMAAHVGSFFAVTLWNYVLNARWAFAASARPDGTCECGPYLRFFLVCLLALAVRGGVFAGAERMFAMPTVAAILCAIGAAAIVSYLGTAFFVFPSAGSRASAAVGWRVAAVGVAIYACVLRLIFLGLVDLWPQEAYYWNYAQHLDIGYLDHPPMVAWLIWVTTGLFGDNEFGVRFAAWLGWFATAFFGFGLTRQLFGKSAAFVSLLLVAVLPFFFVTGLLMTPDAPLVAAWAGTLYFLARALIGGQRNAWWGVGACIGLGMLSKYTIVLLVPAMLLFMLGDRRARRWLLRREPYLAAALALLIFSPVIYWNIENGLASFAFQSLRRIESTFRFSLPQLVANTALLLTPLGLVAALAALRAPRDCVGAGRTDEDKRRIWRFLLVFTLTPLAVFIAFSLTRGVKLNWTGPLWLAALPAMSAAIIGVAERASGFELTMRRLWVHTTAISLLAYGLALNYLVLGIPTVGYVARLPAAPIAWSEFGDEAARLARDVKQATGREPLMIGLDTYNVASQLAFYGDTGGDGPTNSVGRGILGMPGLMYAYWYRAEPLRGRPAIMFAFKRHQIGNPVLATHFSALGNPVERAIVKEGAAAGRFYYRIGQDFRGGQVSRPGRGIEP